MTWLASRRATLLIPSGPAHDPDRKHLHIVLTDPGLTKDDSKAVLVVSVCSIPRSNLYDSSCTLFPGEHPFVVSDSYIAYQFTDLVDPTHLEDKVKANVFIAKPILDEKVFGFVIDGLRESPHTPPRYLRFFENNCGKQDKR